MHWGKKWRSALWLNAMHSGKKSDSYSLLYILYILPFNIYIIVKETFTPKQEHFKSELFVHAEFGKKDQRPQQVFPCEYPITRKIM